MQIFDQLNQAYLIVCADDFSQVNINPSACKLLKLNAEKILNKDWKEIFVPAFTQSKVQDFAELCYNGLNLKLHFSTLEMDGEQLLAAHLEPQKKPMANADFFCVFKEILGSQDIYFLICDGILDGRPHAGLGGQMDDQFGPDLRKEFGGLLPVAQVHVCAAGHDDLAGPFGFQAGHHGLAEEAASAGDQHPPTGPELRHGRDRTDRRRVLRHGGLFSGRGPARIEGVDRKGRVAVTVDTMPPPARATSS